ncbi:MAG: hypothetical protein RLZZ264_217 [Bacillota bacterium]|jgi:uncharacterized protein (TIGR00288 family)
METRKKIALLIDYDNFNQEKYFPILFEALNDIGDVIMKYAFYSNFNDATIKNKFIRFGIEPRAQIAYSSGKNAVDIGMTIEAMELLNHDYIDCVCLATNDSDFTPLIKTIQKHNRYVVGAGDNKASENFKDACNTFISVEKIASNQNITSKGLILNDLIAVVDKIIDDLTDGDEFADFASVMHDLRVQMKDFNPKNYGANKQKPISFFQNELKNYYEMSKQGTTHMIRLKKRTK